MSGPQRLVSFVLACASSVIVAGAQSRVIRDTGDSGQTK
jgi:hypothetical protein